MECVLAGSGYLDKIIGFHWYKAGGNCTFYLLI